MGETQNDFFMDESALPVHTVQLDSFYGVNGDSSVNVFDLVMVAGNFGKSNVAAAPLMSAKGLDFSTQQKRSIQSAIVELEDMSARSQAEELVLSLLIAMLPERLPEQTQLLPNYPNPFNPET